MEIRYVSDEEKEGLTEYLNLLYDVNGSTDKLVEIIYDGCKYLVADGKSGVGIVENNGDGLNPYFINMEDPFFKVYGTDKIIYNIVDSYMKEVIKSSVDGTFRTEVSFLPAVDNHPRNIIFYGQYIKAVNALLELRYDVTTRQSIEDSIAYTFYQLPDDMRIQYLKKFGPFEYAKTSFYGRSIDEDEVFYKPRVMIREIPYGQKKKTYNGRILINEFENNGFKKQIPEELSSILIGTNKEYKTLKLINNEYKKYINGQD